MNGSAPVPPGTHIVGMIAIDSYQDALPRVIGPDDAEHVALAQLHAPVGGVTVIETSHDTAPAGS